MVTMKVIIDRTFTWICIVSTLLLGMGHPPALASNQQMDCSMQQNNTCKEDQSCFCEKNPKKKSCCSTQKECDDTELSVNIRKPEFIVFNIELFNKTCSCGFLSNTQQPVSQTRDSIVKHTQLKLKKECLSVSYRNIVSHTSFHFPQRLVHFDTAINTFPASYVGNVCLRI